ncbi:beta-alanine transporter-like [Pieris rapae]|uniref:beta-alanine transporter-like n=1 Tax=Pieris rapae TaxID=64459 RepID=UPI001E27EC19|nr:beta-alanine transporter-like [Pieris rapae]
MDFDAILEDVGEFSRFQKLVIYLILLPAVIPCGFHAYSQLFMAGDVKHWCKVPDLEGLDVELTKNFSIPQERRNGILDFSQCNMYDINYTDILSRYSTIEEALMLEGPADIVPCKNGWVYEDTVYQSTVVTEWDLVCDKDFLPTLGLVLLAVGGIIGNYIFGYLQDTFGRKPSFFIYLLIECIFGVATAFAQNYYIWLIFRFGVGFTVPAIMATPYVLAIELVGPRSRTLCTILSNIAYSMGLILLAGVVYLVRDWRYLALATTLPFVCFFLYIWLMPESPRWLLARGQFEKAEVILKKMARINGKSLPKNYMVHLRRKYESDKLQQDLEKEKLRTYGIFDLFRTPNMRKKTIIITFIWFTNTSVYVGLSYYAPVLGGDEFLNFFLAGVVELPTYLFLWPSMERLGRRWTLCMSMVVGGVACLTTFLVQHETNVTLALYCVGKMGISSSFVVLPLMASELYPTVVRGLGMSLSSVLGMLGPIFIPLVNYLGSDIMVLPLIIMGALLVAGGIASLLLPETLNQHLPQTLEDGEKMGLDTDFCCSPPVKEPKNESVKTTCKNCSALCSCQMVSMPLVENVSPEKDLDAVEFILVK